MEKAMPTFGLILIFLGIGVVIVGISMLFNNEVQQREWVKTTLGDLKDKPYYELRTDNIVLRVGQPTPGDGQPAMAMSVKLELRRGVSNQVQASEIPSLKVDDRLTEKDSGSAEILVTTIHQISVKPVDNQPNLVFVVTANIVKGSLKPRQSYTFTMDDIDFNAQLDP